MSDLITSVQESDEDVIHWGVLGMRWGVRRNRSGSSTEPKPVQIKVVPGKKIKTKGGENSPISEDARAVAITRQIVKKSSTDAVSTKELQALVNRMNLEQQYSKLSSSSKEVSAGKKFVKDTLKSEVHQLSKGKKGAIAIAITSAVAAQRATKYTAKHAGKRGSVFVGKKAAKYVARHVAP